MGFIDGVDGWVKRDGSEVKNDSGGLKSGGGG